MKAPQQSPDFPDAFYRVTVKGLVVEGDKLMFIEDAEALPIEWELPGGGLDFGEKLQEGVAREVREEMGLEVSWVGERPLYMYPQRRQNRRGMEWFYVMVVCFPMKLDYSKFTPTDSCRSLVFWDKEQMRANEEKISNQIKPLIDLFNPGDFK